MMAIYTIKIQHQRCHPKNIKGRAMADHLVMVSSIHFPSARLFNYLVDEEITHTKQKPMDNMMFFSSTGKGSDNGEIFLSSNGAHIPVSKLAFRSTSTVN